MSTHPRASRSSARREAILEGAARVIREHGVMATTTRRIAWAASCSEGSIYNHFASKDELVAQAVSERLATFPDHALALPKLAGSGTVEGNLADLAASAIAFFAEIAPMTAAAIAEPEAMRQRAAEWEASGTGPRRIVGAIVSYLEREQGLGRVDGRAHLRGAAVALLGGAWHQAHLGELWNIEVLAAADPAAEITAAVMGGLRPGASGPAEATEMTAARGRTG